MPAFRAGVAPAVVQAPFMAHCIANHGQLRLSGHSAQTNILGGEMKATEMFVMVALILLVFALIARFISPSALGVSITWWKLCVP